VIPFPGASVPLYDAWSSLGTDLSNIDKRYGSAEITVGEEWRCWTFGDDVFYLEDADPVAVQVSWVIEVIGGAGLLDVSEYLDDYTQSTTVDFPIDLAQQAVTGAGTYVVPSNLTRAQVTDDDMSPAVRLISTSGTIEIQQVKLRVWPVDGVKGYWVEQAPWSSETTAGVLVGTVSPGISEDGAVESDPFISEADAWADLNEKMPGFYAAWASASKTVTLDDPPFSPASTGIVGTIGMAIAGGLYDEAYASGGASIAMLMGPTVDSIYPINPDLEAYTDYIWPPNEVYGYSDHLWERDEDPTFVWPGSSLDLHLEVTANGSMPLATGPPGGIAVNTWTAPLPDGVPITSPGGSVPPFEMVVPVGGSTLTTHVEGSFTTPVSIPGNSDPRLGLFISMMPTHLQTLPDFSHWIAAGIGSNYAQYSGGITFDELPAITILHPSYRLWDPNALAPPDLVEPVGGYFLDPNANLDGLPDGVDVNFA
jgi:hypothetical protein